jgi:DNA-binding LytR/AlgR family response regulator
MNPLPQPGLPHIEGEQTARLLQVFPALLSPANSQSARIAVKARRRILFVNLSDVVAVHAEGNYVSLRTNSSSHLLRDSISAVAKRLEPHGFIRIHRSVLVNIPFVEEIRPFSTGEYGLRMRGGKEYTVTRTYKKNLKSLAEFWMGTGSSFLNDDAIVP